MTPSRLNSLLQDHTTHFGSLESVSSGEILADDPAAHASAHGLEGSSEQLLWRRWARRSSGSPRSTSLPTSGATAPINAKKSRSPSVLQPPSPLDAGGVSQEIRSWMDDASAQRGAGETTTGESHPSLSSEEGIYSLPALDSDEEDAYSYILGLHEEACQPRDPLNRRVARVEEETEGGVSSRGEQTEETQHLEVFEKTFSGSGHHEDSHVEPEVRAPPGAHRTVGGERSSREMAHNASVFESEEVVPGQSHDGGDPCGKQMIQEVTEYDRSVKRGRDEREALTGERKDSTLCDGESRKIEVERETEKRGHGIEDEEKEEGNVPKIEEERERKSMEEQEEEDRDEEGDMDMEGFTRGDDTDDVMDPDGRAAQQEDRNRGRRELTDGPTAPRHAPDGGVHVRGVERGGALARPAASQSFR